MPVLDSKNGKEDYVSNVEEGFVDSIRLSEADRIKMSYSVALLIATQRPRM